MTKRCKHEFDIKVDYPNDRICHKCQTIWTITDYKNWTAKQLMTLPTEIRFEILTLQSEKFAKDFLKDNPHYYKD